MAPSSPTTPTHPDGVAIAATPFTYRVHHGQLVAFYQQPTGTPLPGADTHPGDLAVYLTPDTPPDQIQHHIDQHPTWACTLLAHDPTTGRYQATTTGQPIGEPVTGHYHPARPAPCVAGVILINPALPERLDTSGETTLRTLTAYTLAILNQDLIAAVNMTTGQWVYGLQDTPDDIAYALMAIAKPDDNPANPTDPARAAHHQACIDQLETRRRDILSAIHTQNQVLHDLHLARLTTQRALDGEHLATAYYTG